MIKISLTNAKLGGTIPSLNLPTTTCRADAPCKHGCYAKKGNWLYKNVLESLENNLKEFLKDPNNFFNQVENFLKNGDICYKFFRWFSSGDIVNERFFSGMVEIAKKTPETKFLCFTKKFKIVNDYITAGGTIPDNLRVVFSAWDKNFKVDNPHRLPVAFVYFKDSTKNPDINEYAIPCTGSCRTCKACWSLKNGQAVYFKQH